MSADLIYFWKWKAKNLIISLCISKLHAWFLRCFVTSSQRQRVVGLHTTLPSHKDVLYWFSIATHGSEVQGENLLCHNPEALSLLLGQTITHAPSCFSFSIDICGICHRIEIRHHEKFLYFSGQDIVNDLKLIVRKYLD
jgi:hypothetical protein